MDPGRVEDEDIYCVEKVDVLGWVALYVSYTGCVCVGGRVCVCVLMLLLLPILLLV